MALTELDLRAGPGEAGRTVTAVLKERSSFSHAVARGAIARGEVRVNDHPVRDAALRLKEGDHLQARLDPDRRLRGGALPGRREGPGYRILLEDRHLLVVEKQAGVITVPAPGHEEGSLVHRLVQREGHRGVRTPRLFVIHRIDRFTSGLVLFARSEEAAGPLLAQFKQRTPVREYLAICHGIPDPPEQRLESILQEDPKSLKVRERHGSPRGGRTAITRFRVEERLNGAALLRVTLETGRRNQIRVQLAGIGHSLLGDLAYGQPSSMIARVALHAARLQFNHPVSGAPIRVESPLPDDFRALLRRLRREPPTAR